MRFASKRVAHQAPNAEVHTTFNHLDAAVEVLKATTEKYTLLHCKFMCEQFAVGHLETEHRIKMSKEDLRTEMLSGFAKGWESVFLIAWATVETLALPLGDMKPPSSKD